MSLILDIQGFNIEKNKFIVKELAGYDGEKVCHFIFRHPFPFEMLSQEDQKEVNWIMKNHHCVNWKKGFTPLHKFGQVVQDLTSKAERVYVKGREKAEYLRRFSAKTIFELPEQPRLDRGKPSCFYHNNEYCFCALSNVHFLYENFLMHIE